MSPLCESCSINNARVRGVRNLHAKLYIFGESRAIITSCNLTEAALTRKP